MSSEQAAASPQYPPNLSELRAEVERLRAELEAIQQAQSAQVSASESSPADQQAQLIGSSVVGSSIIAGQYNTADTATTLECTAPATTLNLLNHASGTSATGSPVGLYVLLDQGVGIIVSANGTPPFPVISKAIQAFCEQGHAIWADSLYGSAMYAHTTNGDSAIIADQESANPRSTAVVALGGYGVGVYASGATAAVQLGMSSFGGPPTSGPHEAGELVLDADANLYLCKLSGTPGTWNQIG
jgi:hypothetical protein